ncbi:tniB domain protein [Vibrio cholerae HC-51A1]|nr:tniB domain protein [Vibrio cholerae HC-51A1]
MDAFVRRKTGQALGHRHQVGQVDDGIFFHGYHSSIWSNGLAGGWLSACESAMSASGGGVVLKRTAVALRCWRRSASRRALRVAFCAVDTISRIWPIMRNSADSSTCSRPCCRNFASACRCSQRVTAGCDKVRYGISR